MELILLCFVFVLGMLFRKYCNGDYIKKYYDSIDAASVEKTQILQDFTFSLDSIDKFLGSGSFGFVYQAQKHKNDKAKTFAVKIIFPNLQEDSSLSKEQDNLQSETIREYTNLKNKKHPNIVKISNCTIQQFSFSDMKTLAKISDDKIGVFMQTAKRKGKLDVICLKMELCGKTLKKWLSETSPKFKSINFLRKQCNICQDIVDGMTFLHYNGILHRDLKPANIMFATGFDLPLKIGDFGLCREIKFRDEGRSSDLLTAGIGTELYNAPEKYTNNYRFPSDLYSMGLVIWEVAQFIPGSEKAKLFTQLVKSRQTRLVKPHPIFINVQEVVINLTKQEHRERTQSISSVKLEFGTNYKDRQTSMDMGNDGDDMHSNLESRNFEIKSKPVAHMVAQIRAKQLATRYSQDNIRKIICTHIDEYDNNPTTLVTGWIKSFRKYKETSELITKSYLNPADVERTGFPNKYNKTFEQLSMALDWIETRKEKIVQDVRIGRLYNGLQNEIHSTLPRLQSSKQPEFWGNETSSVSTVLLYGMSYSSNLIDRNISMPGAAQFFPFLHYSLPSQALMGGEYPFATENGLLLFGDYQYGGHRKLGHPLIFGPEDASSSIGKATGLCPEQVNVLNTRGILAAFDNPENSLGYRGITRLDKEVSANQLEMVEAGDILHLGQHTALVADKPDNQGNVITLQFTRNLELGHDQKKCGGGIAMLNLVGVAKTNPIHILRPRVTQLMPESCSLSVFLDKIDEKFHDHFPFEPINAPGDCDIFI